MAAARRVSRNRPIVFSPLISLEDTVAGDRGLVATSSLRARVLRTIDRRAFRAADLVVADTSAHAEFFARSMGLAPDRLAVCFVGADDGVFSPGPGSRDPFTVLFVGKLIPLHGVDTILAAAALAPQVAFRVVGSGQLDGLMAKAPPNVTHEKWIEYTELPAVYRAAGCALGVFGTSAKAARVIPNKAFQALATATPLVTSDTPAARELLVDGESALLVPPGDPDRLAGAIRRLASDAWLRERLGSGGRATYEEHATELVLGRRWRSLLESLVAQGTRASAK
jgi:glycosyltransferase involved in cell wall biosynthesis